MNMILDIEMLRAFYADYKQNVSAAREALKRPLTYAEKVLYSHLYSLHSCDRSSEVKTM